MNTRSEKYEERIIQINTEEIEAERWNRLLSSLERIAAALEMQVPDMIHKRRIQDYDGFDFATIGAEVVDSDQYGATQILYRGKIYKRRSGKEDYGVAVWFSRSLGSNQWETAIKFVPVTESKPLGKAEIETLERMAKEPEAPNGDPKPQPSKRVEKVKAERPPEEKPEQVYEKVAGEPYVSQPVPLGMYHKIAKAMGFPEEAINRIPGFMGITDPGADYYRPMRSLEVFQVGRAAEMTFGEVRDLLIGEDFDFDRAIDKISLGPF